MVQNRVNFLAEEKEREREREREREPHVTPEDLDEP